MQEDELVPAVEGSSWKSMLPLIGIIVGVTLTFLIICAVVLLCVKPRPPEDVNHNDEGLSTGSGSRGQEDTVLQEDEKDSSKLKGRTLGFRSNKTMNEIKYIKEKKSEWKGIQVIIEDYQQYALDEHNRLRKLHKAQEMKLKGMLTVKAAECAEHYLILDKIDHSCPFKKDSTDLEEDPLYGENLYLTTKEGTPMENAERAVHGWYDEWMFYDFKNGLIKPEAKANNEKIGHFTQLVWKASKYLGVAMMCDEKEKNKCVVVCLYDPIGNVKGEYIDNVLPKS